MTADLPCHCSLKRDVGNRERKRPKSKSLNSNRGNVIVCYTLQTVTIPLIPSHEIASLALDRWSPITRSDKYNMNKSIFALLLTFITGAFAFGQDASDGYKKGEFFVGYSNGQVDTGLGDIDEEFPGVDLDDRETFHGFNVSGVYNMGRYFGAKADVSGVYNSRNFSFTVPVVVGSAGGVGTGTVAFETDNSLYNFLGGIQVKDNANSGSFKPFAHALVGAAHGRTKINSVSCPTGVDCSLIVGGSETNLSGAFGGGLDIRVNNRFQIRAVQIDWNPIWFEGGRQDNIRIGVGVVF